MDFLDPKKQRAHMIRLIVGYVLIGTAVLIATAILLYRANGFGLGKDGEVVQNGLVFVSSQPNNADIFINSTRYKDTTGSRLQLPEADYKLAIKKDGYREWQRAITVEGGSVSRYDYPLLIPNELTPAQVKNYTASPNFATQSPDRRWMLISQPGNMLGFDVYDTRDAEQVSVNTRSISLPSNVVTSVTEDQTWKLTEWSTDNRHVILEHTYSGGTEYILVDHEEPERSLNLTKTLGLSVGEVLTLRDKKFDKYYIFNPEAKTVASATVADTTNHTQVLAGVVSFKSYGQDILLYATEAGATPGTVMTMLRDGDVTYKIREVGVGAPYLLDLARYDGDWYVAVGASAENKAYVFKNPQEVRKAGQAKNLVPARVLRVTAPNYLAFSSNTRFVMIENATSFAVYDAETDKAYTYATSLPLDPGVAHANWMDGHRITYVSGEKSVIFDYDNINFQTLVATNPAYQPFFDRDYRNLYTLAPPVAGTGQSPLTSTPLLIEKDR
ncbi:MAG: hypothetical protein JWP13_530 [Candidatus Saccharibacteria bacterium]|nr:hypothetical protein [Candidatus Saccharibacteria bacterium]